MGRARVTRRRSSSGAAPAAEELEAWDELDAYMADGLALFAESWAAGCEPEPRLSVSEWSARFRILPSTSPEPGPYRWERTPYVREILDALSAESDVERVVVMKGAQLGLTTAGENFIGYVISHNPGPILYVQPTSDLAEEVSKTRIAPMIADSPKLRGLVTESRSKRSENTIALKEFPGGYLRFTGANSAVGFRNRAIRFLFLDEIDGYPPDVGGEGDPVALAFKRTDTFVSGRKALLTSTPTIRGASRIEAEFEQTDQRVYEIPCPYCDAFQAIAYGRIVDFDEATETAKLECEACGEKIDEAHKHEMLARGRWIPTREADRPRVRGYRISALYSPWKTWGQCVAEHKAAKKRGKLELQTWVNTVLAETWEEIGQDEVEEDALAARVEEYPAPVPGRAVLLTAGVDVQADRVEVEVVAWGPGEESWGVEYAVLWGDTAARRNAGVWPDLEAFLSRTWRHEYGDELGLYAVLIDSGFRTQEVYRFVKGRSARRWFAAKGYATPGMPVISGKPQRKRSGRRERHVDLFLVGTDQASAVVQSRLTREDGFGVCHWPNGRGYDLDYFRQLTSMRSTTRYRRGVPLREWHVRAGRRNEAFDCRVYAYAALQLQPLDLGQLAAIRERRRGASGASTDEGAAPATSSARPRDPGPTRAPETTRRPAPIRRRRSWKDWQR